MTEAHQMSQPSPARVCLRWLDTADERDVAHVVEIAELHGFTEGKVRHAIYGEKRRKAKRSA